MRTPKVIDPPKTIYLVAGDLDEDAPFEELHEVSWCADRIGHSDVEYRLVNPRVTTGMRDPEGAPVKSPFVRQPHYNHLENRIREIESPCTWKAEGGVYHCSCDAKERTSFGLQWMKHCPYCGHRIFWIHPEGYQGLGVDGMYSPTDDGEGKS